MVCDRCPHGTRYVSMDGGSRGRSGRTVLSSTGAATSLPGVLHVSSRSLERKSAPAHRRGARLSQGACSAHGSSRADETCHEWLLCRPRAITSVPERSRGGGSKAVSARPPDACRVSSHSGRERLVLVFVLEVLGRRAAAQILGRGIHRCLSSAASSSAQVDRHLPGHGAAGSALRRSEV